MSLSHRKKTGLSVKSKIVKSTAVATTVGVIVFGILFGPKVYETSKKQVIQTKNKITYTVKDRLSSFQNPIKKETLKIEKADIPAKEQPSKAAAAHFEQEANEIVVDPALLAQSTENKTEQKPVNPKKTLGMIDLDRILKPFILDNPKKEKTALVKTDSELEDKKEEAEHSNISYQDSASSVASLQPQDYSKEKFSKTISQSTTFSGIETAKKETEVSINLTEKKNIDELSQEEIQYPSAKEQPAFSELQKDSTPLDIPLEPLPEKQEGLVINQDKEVFPENSSQTLLGEARYPSLRKKKINVETLKRLQSQEKKFTFQNITDKNLSENEVVLGATKFNFETSTSIDNFNPEQNMRLYYNYKLGRNILISDNSLLSVNALLFGSEDIVQKNALVGAELGVGFTKVGDKNSFSNIYGGIGITTSNILTGRLNWKYAFNDRVEFQAGMRALYDSYLNRTNFGASAFFRIGFGGALNSSSNSNRKMDEDFNRYVSNDYLNSLFKNKTPQQNNQEQENNNPDITKPTIIGPVDDGRGMQF